MADNNDWNEWKRTLSGAVDIGETMGFSDKTITKMAERVGSYLASNVEPRNPEERLLKEMWEVAESKDKEILAKLIVKMTD
jgi:hypothetical protein